MSATLRAQTITLRVKDAPLVSVFEAINRQSGVNFIYTSELLEKTKPLSLNLRNQPLKIALERVFSGQPLTYHFEDGYVIVTPGAEPPRSNNRVLKGRVINEAGESISGTSVQLKGSSHGTATRHDGSFSLPAEDERVTLLVSSVGYQQQEIAASSASEIQICLRQAVSKLDEMMIIAYGNTSRRLSTGNFSKISIEEIERQPVDNPIAAIQGRTPGVFVTTLNGMPGGNFKVEIRGRGSLMAGTAPLYIVDGVPFSSQPLNKGLPDFIAANGEISPLAGINPLDIESIEVLKDADATSIYGSRGANGVIMITTKKAKPGDTKFKVNFSRGISQVSQLPEMLNTRDYLQLRREGFSHDGITPTTTNAPELTLWDTSQYTNWPRYMWGNTASRINLFAGITGGDVHTNFRLAGFYRNQGTVLPGDEYYREGGGSITLFQASENKRFNLQLTAAYYTGASDLMVSSTLSALSLPPNFPLYDANGTLNWTGTTENPLAMLDQRAKANNTNLLSNLSLKYDLAHGLAMTVNLGYNTYRLQQVLTRPKASISPQSPQPTSSAAFATLNTSLFLAEPQLTYNLTTGLHTINILTGAGSQHQLTKGNLVRASGFTNDALLASLEYAANIDYTRRISTEYKYISVFGRVKYDFAHKYLFSTTFRRDGSSKFGPRNQFGNFGSAAAAWIFSEERFFKRFVNIINYAKIRASYGITGNDQVPDYQYLSTYTWGAPYQYGSTLVPSIIANPRFSWESNHKFEAALELGLWQDRLFFAASWYRHRTANQLVGYDLPFQSGFTSFLANLPALVENTGVELELNGDLLKTDNSRWSLSFNFTKPKNRLLAYPGLQSSAYASMLVIGEDLAVVKGYHYLGPDPATGLAIFQDVNNDGQITQPDDYIIIGKSSPEFFGGLGQQLKLKNFSFDLYFQFVQQRSRGAEVFPGHSRNQFTTVLERWQRPGDITRIPAAASTPGTPGFTANSKLAFSDAFFYNASYLRFKTLAVSYALPEKITGKMGVEQALFYINAENVITIKSKANLYDPETLQGGIPPLRTIMAGIQLSF